MKASSRPISKADSSLYDVLWEQYSATENYHGQKFISVEAVQREFNHGRLVQWIKGHSLHRQSEFSAYTAELIDIILRESRLLFAILVLAGLEQVFSLLTVHGLNDDNLFNVQSFEEACKSAALTEREKGAVAEHRRRVGAVLRNNEHHTFPKGTILPYRNVNHPKDDRFGGFGVVRRVEIAAGHLKGYSEVGVESLSKVRLVHHVQRFVALKQVRPLDNGNQDEWDRFYREVETLQRMRHPNIVPLLASYFLDTFDSSDRLMRTMYLLFPWAEMDLEKWMTCSDVPTPLQQFSRSERRAYIYRSMCALLSALSYLHREHGGLITSHHDLKPSNVLVVGQILMISDLGRSHLRPADGGSSTEGATGLGTFEYQPPEYWEDNGSRAKIKHGRAFDIWAMGCILIELATLIVHDWEPGMVSRFRRERASNLTRNRPKLAESRNHEDSSFHNNWVVVEDWVIQLKRHSRSSRALEETLDVAMGMLTSEPASRLYSWECELDLHNVQNASLAHVRATTEDSLGVQSPRKSHGHEQVLNGAQTPLHRAASKEDTKRMIALLEVGWPMFAQDRAGSTPLDIIKQSASKDFRELFSSHLGQGFAAIDVFQGMKLFQAAEIGDVVIIRSLLQNGVNPVLVNPEDISCLSVAVMKGHISAIHELLQSNSKEQLLLKDRLKSETALHLAVITCQKDVVEKLLSFSPDLEDRQHEGKTALFLAAEKDQKNLVMVFLDHQPGAQVFTQCERANTPIHIAVNSNRELLELLLNAKNSARCLEHKNQYGETPIWLALRHQDFEAFRMLKERGASLRTANNDHDNLLHLVARQKLYDFLNQNLSAFDPSEVESRNRWNDTPLTIADRNGDQELAALLRSFYTGMKIHNMADVLEIPSEKPKLFYTLGSEQKWIRPDSEGYWRHLTYESYQVYEQIWSLAAGNRAKGLQFTDFTKQFNPHDPRPETIEYVWRRLLTSPNSDVRTTWHPKPFVLAILYMLHIERFSSERPRGDTNQPGEVKAKRRGILKRFDCWVPCNCRRKCPNEWNFVGDLGIYRSDSEETGKCRVVHVVEDYKTHSSFFGPQNWRREKDYEIWKSMLSSWKRS